MTSKAPWLNPCRNLTAGGRTRKYANPTPAAKSAGAHSRSGRTARRSAGAIAGEMNAHAWISRNGNPRRSAKAKATVTEVENGSPTPSVIGARASGRASDRLGGGGGRAPANGGPVRARAGGRPAGGRERAGRVRRGPLVGPGEGGGVREPGERAGAARQRLGQLAMG